ncbi:aldo/keto reductase [Streptosporangium saharense]|uniref:aldo/keto reductase n=1 Tax=Streptosporangium saharense TaxID=1706840 RepID=UPI00341F4C1B
MRYRLLGRTGLRVSEVFLGAMTFGEEQVARRILELYGEAGGNVIDTANFYSGGRSETILGELLEGRRDRFVVASKYAVSRDGGDPNAADSHRKNLTLSLETGLRRLGTDYLDLYALRDAANLEELQELRAAAVSATDRLVDVAGAHLAAVAGEKRPKKRVAALTPSSVAQ